MTPSISVEIRQPEDMRYPTVGDYYKSPDGTLHIEVADTGNLLANLLILSHEVNEALLVLDAGIPLEAIDKWDTEHLDLDDPGDDENAPYHDQHSTAMFVEEHLCIEMLTLDWEAYTVLVNQTYERAKNAHPELP